MITTAIPYGQTEAPPEASATQAVVLRALSEALYVTDPHRKVEILSRNLDLARKARLPPFIIVQIEGRLAAAQRAATLKEETEASQRVYSAGGKFITYGLAALVVVSVLYVVRRL